LVISCVPPQYLTKEQSERIVEHNVNLSKEEIKINVLSYINEKFGSGKAVIQSNEDGFIAGNVIFYIGASDLLGLYGDYLETTFLIKYQTNNYRVKYIIKNLYTEIRGKIDIHPYYWGKYSAKIDSALTNFDNDLLKYLSERTNF
jgi:hypothetical protein